MNRFVGFLFGAGYGPFSRLVSTLLGQHLRAFTLDYATLQLVLANVAAGTYPPAAAGGYSIVELSAMVDDVTDLVGGVLTEYQLAGTISPAQLARLLETVAVSVTPPAP